MIIAVANQKGGVGKTTTAVTLAHGAARAGRSVLLIDLDSQGNAADCLGLEAGGELYDWLGAGKALERVISASGRERLEVIRSDKTTGALKMALAGMDFRERVLANALEGYWHELVVLDCAPSVDVLHTAALVAADWLIIPTKLDQLAVKGAAEILTSLATVRKMTNSRCQLAGIIPTFYDRQTRESHMQLVNLAEAFGERVWAPVLTDTRVRTANRKGLTVWEMESGRAAAGYADCLERLMKLKGARR